MFFLDVEYVFSIVGTSEYRVMHVEELGEAVLDSEGDARFEFYLKLEKDVDKSSLSEPELEVIVSHLSKCTANYTLSNSRKYGYGSGFTLHFDFDKLRENDYYLLRAYIDRATKASLLD